MAFLLHSELLPLIQPSLRFNCKCTDMAGSHDTYPNIFVFPSDYFQCILYCFTFLIFLKYSRNNSRKPRDLRGDNRLKCAKQHLSFARISWSFRVSTSRSWGVNVTPTPIKYKSRLIHVCKRHSRAPLRVLNCPLSQEVRNFWPTHSLNIYTYPDPQSFLFEFWCPIEKM